MKKFYLRFVNVFLALVLAAQTATPVFAIADGDKAETLPTLPITELTEGENTNPEPTTLPMSDLADAENVNSESTLPTTDLTDAEEIQSNPALPMTDLTDAAETEPKTATPPAQTAEEENKETNPAPSAQAEGGENIEKAPAQPAPELAEAKTVGAENQSLAAVPANTYPITTQVIGGKVNINIDKTNAIEHQKIIVDITGFKDEINKELVVIVNPTGKNDVYHRVYPIEENVPEGIKRFYFTMPEKAVTVKAEVKDIITITAQPVSQTVAIGDTATFKIDTKCLEKYHIQSYQWQVLTRYDRWENIQDATQKYYQIENTSLNDNGKQLRCIASCRKHYGSYRTPEVASDAVILTVRAALPTDRTIIAVQDAQPIKVDYGKYIERVDLPKEVTVTLSDNSQKQLGVAWDTSNYDKELEDDYILIGNLIMQDGILNSKQLTAKIKVTVNEDDDPAHSFRDDLIHSLEDAYTSLKCIPLRPEYKEHLIKEILKAEAVLDSKNPTSRDYITVNRTLSKIAESMPNNVWYFTSPEDVYLDDIEHWVKHLPNLIEITMFTQESRNRLAGEINKYQLALEKLTKTEPEYDDENDDESKMLVYNQWLEQVQDTYKFLTTDVKKLEPVRPTGYPGKNGLKNLLEFARTKAADSKYTQATRYDLNKAIKTAQVVFDNEKADFQQVSDAEWAIKNAIDLLEENPYKPLRGGGGGGGGSSRRRGSSGGSGGSGGGSSDGGNYVQPQTGTVWDINNSLTKSKYGINVTINADDKLSTAFLNELIANKNKSVTLKGDWYNWDFYGTSIENTMPGVVWFDTTISTVTPNQVQISKLTGKNDTTVLHFAHQGKLAGKTKITVDIDKYANKKMFVYQYNAAKARLELVQANVNVNANGVMAFTITEGADYIISPTAVKGAVIVPKPVPKPAKKTAVKPVPKK